jgi:hypothetical protein
MCFELNRKYTKLRAAATSNGITLHARRASKVMLQECGLKSRSSALSLLEKPMRGYKITLCALLNAYDLRQDSCCPSGIGDSQFFVKEYHG